MATIYRFYMPTPERADSIGIRYEGLETRTRLWLMGVAFANYQLTGNPLFFHLSVKDFL